MDNDKERKRARKIAKYIAILIFFSVIVSHILFAVLEIYPINAVIISAPITMLIGMIFPAIILLWKGPIR